MLLWLTLQYHINPIAFYRGRGAAGRGPRAIFRSIAKPKGSGGNQNFGSNSRRVQQIAAAARESFACPSKPIRPISKAFVCDNVR